MSPRTSRAKRTTPWAVDAMYEYLLHNVPCTLRQVLRYATFKNGKSICSSRAGVTINQAARWLKKDARFYKSGMQGTVYIWDVVRGEEE